MARPAWRSRRRSAIRARLRRRNGALRRKKVAGCEASTMLRMAIAMMAIGVMAGGDAWAGTRPQPPIDCRHIGGAARHRDCERANAGDAERQSYVGFLLASGRGAARNDD